jgi:hypothetical protein
LQLIWPWQDRQRKFSWLKASGFALARFHPILDASAVSVETLIKNYHTALAAAEQARVALLP